MKDIMTNKQKKNAVTAQTSQTFWYIYDLQRKLPCCGVRMCPFSLFFLPANNISLNPSRWVTGLDLWDSMPVRVIVLNPHDLTLQNPGQAAETHTSIYTSNKLLRCDLARAVSSFLLWCFCVVVFLSPSPPTPCPPPVSTSGWKTTKFDAHGHTHTHRDVANV